MNVTDINRATAIIEQLTVLYTEVEQLNILGKTVARENKPLKIRIAEEVKE